MSNDVSPIERICMEYRDQQDWDCLPRLVEAIGRMTGSDAWNREDFADGVLLYGAGSIGAGAMEYFVEQGINVVGFVDDTPAREGASYHDRPILSLRSALGDSRPIVISMKSWQRPAAKLREAGRPCEPFAHYVIRANLERLSTIAREFFNDDRSRHVYLTVLKATVLSDYSLFTTVYEPNHYWAIPEFQCLDDTKGVMVDAGAYVGSVMEEYVWRCHGILERVHAFEPNPRVHAALRSRANRLCREWALPDDAIVCVPAGLGAEEANVPFFDTGTRDLTGGSFLFAQGTQTGEIPVKTLDTYLAGAPVTHLKSDVEGFEIPLLHGAYRSIKTYRPKIAMSIYHRLTDWFEIPLLLRSMAPEYKMALRHHTTQQADTVLYCWV